MAEHEYTVIVHEVHGDGSGTWHVEGTLLDPPNAVAITFDVETEPGFEAGHQLLMALDPGAVQELKEGRKRQAPPAWTEKDAAYYRDLGVCCLCGQPMRVGDPYYLDSAKMACMPTPPFHVRCRRDRGDAQHPKAN